MIAVSLYCAWALRQHWSCTALAPRHLYCLADSHPASCSHGWAVPCHAQSHPARGCQQARRHAWGERAALQLAADAHEARTAAAPHAQPQATHLAAAAAAAAAEACRRTASIADALSKRQGDLQAQLHLHSAQEAVLLRRPVHAGWQAGPCESAGRIQSPHLRCLLLAAETAWLQAGLQH